MSYKVLIFLSLFWFCGSFSNLWSVISQEIDTKQSIKCVFSSVHQNRVAVEKGRVEKVIFIDDSVAIRMEEESGQAFVCLVRPTSRESVVSIVTDKGNVQDLEINFEDRPSEVVILHESVSSSATKHENQEIGILIKKILSGQAPDCYCCFDGDWEKQNIRGAICLTTIATFEGCRDTIKLVKLKNISRHKHRVCERDLSSPSTQWVHLVKDILLPREETVAIVSYRGDI